MTRIYPVLVLLILGGTALQYGMSRTDNCEEVNALPPQLQDWASLSYYRAANAKILPPAHDEDRVVFLGDSITALWDAPQAGGFFPGRPYINRGISAQTTPQMLIRFQADVIALQPRVVVILAGTNDLVAGTGPTSLQAIMDNLRSMATLAAASDIRVVLASVLPTHDHGHDQAGKPMVYSRSRPPDRISALNEMLRELASRQGAVYLDYYTAMSDGKGVLRSELSDDGIHPNSRGYAVMAPLAEQAIAAAINRLAAGPSDALRDSDIIQRPQISPVLAQKRHFRQ